MRVKRLMVVKLKAQTIVLGYGKMALVKVAM